MGNSAPVIPHLSGVAAYNGGCTPTKYVLSYVVLVVVTKCGKDLWFIHTLVLSV